MATTYTPTYNLAKPEVGAAADVWGGLLNDDIDAIDAGMAAALLKDGSRAATGKLTFKASDATAASVLMSPGVAPTTPANGDFWFTSGGAFGRFSGATKQFAFTDSNITGSAASLTTSRAIAATGDASWTVNFNGAADASAALTIANDAVTNSKLANMATATFKGRATASTGDPEDLTVTQAVGLLKASNAEVQAGTEANKLVTPAGLYSLMAESGALSASSRSVNLVHGLGARPRRFGVYLRNVVAEHGYIPGDEVIPPTTVDSGTDMGGNVMANSTTVTAVQAQEGWFVFHSSTGQLQPITSGNWSVYLRAWLY